MPTPAHFQLDQPGAYAAWREARLAGYPRTLDDMVVELGSSAGPSDNEVVGLQDALRRCNMGAYRWRHRPSDPQPALLKLGEAFGLNALDRNLCASDSGLSPLTVRDTATTNEYIPYTNRALGWHTDGYYNPPDQQIRGWLLYCAQDAAQGGANGLLDHEIAYIRLRDQNPAWIAALMHRNAFTIPENIEGGSQIRAAQTGPVFSIDPTTGKLHMRYSMRQRNVIWRDDPDTQAAAQSLLDLFSGDDDHIFRARLKPGEGLLANNVLHMRTAFTDDPASGKNRLVYRARYFDRARGT